jgi:hypothetical protein
MGQREPRLLLEITFQFSVAAAGISLIKVQLESGEASWVQCDRVLDGHTTRSKLEVPN